MNVEYNYKAVEAATRKLLQAFGIEYIANTDLEDTPKRVAGYWMEMLEGMQYTNMELAAKFNKTFECDNNNLVVIKDITCFSTCEHHLALMYDLHISVAYIPNGKVIGLSKVPRICEMVCHRLQLQERIGKDIIDVLKLILDTDDIMVVIEGKHGCMTARGIKQPNSSTITASLSGCFDTNATLRQETYDLLRR